MDESEVMIELTICFNNKIISEANIYFVSIIEHKIVIFGILYDHGVENYEPISDN